jgi:hypothetical protein
MELPEGVLVKFSIYLLACREFLNRLSALYVGTHRDDIISDDICIERFNEKLFEFFERSSNNNNLKQAADSLGNRLHTEAIDIRGENKQAANVLDEVVGGILDNAETFNYQSELDGFHVRGREIGIEYFRASPWVDIEQISKRFCSLDVRYVDVKYGVFEEVPSRACFTHKNPYHPTTPMAYCRNIGGRPDVIHLNFTFGHNFYSFLSYLFWFIHEYTAHIFANDHNGNEIFNDGWLLHAIDNFLRSKTVLADATINAYQINVFTEHLIDGLIRSARIGRSTACSIASLPLEDPDRFNQITYELAAFQPQLGEERTWPTDFINALGEQYVISRERLLEKIDASDCIRSLMKTLLLI